MFFRILKNDLRHRKVTNTILLLFIALAATFVSSSVNNIVTIVSAQDEYFERAGMGDMFVLLRETDGDMTFENELKKIKAIDSYDREKLLFIDKDHIKNESYDGDDITNVIMVSSLEGSPLTYFDADNRTLESIGRGELYVPQKIIGMNAMRLGDTLKISVGDASVAVTVKGTVKDAVFGSTFVGGNRILISAEDLETLFSDENSKPYMGSFYSLTASDTAAANSELVDTGITTLSQGTKDMLKYASVMDVIVAAMFLVVSAVLIIISFVVLSFTIKFTLEQEFREIGVMKAIGLPDSRIMSLYMTKYLFMSAVGAVIGFIAGIPLGNYLMRNASANMVIESHDPYGINVLCVTAVMLTVVMYCRRCVRKLRKYSPADAVRSGNNGETYSKKSPVSLSRSKQRPAGFLAVNDILTGARTFGVMAVTFTLSLIIIIIVADTINTLRSGDIVTMMGMAESDVYMTHNSLSTEYLSPDGREKLEKYIEKTEKTLRDNGMDGKVFADAGAYVKLKNGDNKCNVYAYQGINCSADMCVYMEGTAPLSENEIAVTPSIAETLGADIGDTVTLVTMEGERGVMITALYQSMMNMGNAVRLHEDAEMSFAQCAGINSIQIKFCDSPDKEETQRRMEKLRELYPEYKVLDGGGYIDKLINVAPILEKVRLVLLPILLAVCALVTVLMERSLIAKEKSEIAILKACGFADGSIVRWHMLRVVIVTLLSTVIAVPLSAPAAQLTSGIAFRIMGAQTVKFVIDPLEVMLIYPAVVLSLTLAAVWLTAQSTRRITASQTAGIE